jgi:hypothetical protein
LSRRRTSQPASPPSPRLGRQLDALELEPRVRQCAQAELLLGLRDAQARRVARHHERVVTAVVARDHEEVARGSASGTKLFAPDSTKPLPLGSASVRGSSGSNVGTRLDPRERRGVEALAAEQRQQRRALRVGALVDHRVGERGRRERGDRERRVAPGQLFRDDRVGDRRARLAATAVRLGNRRRHEAERLHLFEEVGGDLGRLVARARDRAHRLLGELVHRLAGELLLLGGFERDHAWFSFSA